MKKNGKIAIVFVAPQLLVILIFFIWPAASAIQQSFYFADSFGLYRLFAGFANYSDLFQDPSFLQALRVSLIIAVFITLVTMSLGLLLASLVQSCQKSRPVYKAMLLWPYAVAPAVAAILWRFLCQPSLGWVSKILQAFGFEFNYLIHPTQALVVIVLTASWQQLSYNFLFYLAALQAVPRSLTEAAILDGASVWSRFWQIILPLLSPTSFFLLIINLTYAFFDTFGIIDVLTHGGPENQTTTLIYKVYKDGFVGMDPGSSSAQSVLLMILVTGLTLLQFLYVEKKVHYE